MQRVPTALCLAVVAACGVGCRRPTRDEPLSSETFTYTTWVPEGDSYKPVETTKPFPKTLGRIRAASHWGYGGPWTTRRGQELSGRLPTDEQEAIGALENTGLPPPYLVIEDRGEGRPPYVVEVILAGHEVPFDTSVYPGTSHRGDEALEHVLKFRDLAGIELLGTRVTTEGLVGLKPLKRLVWLGLSENHGDDALARLGEVPTLRMVDLSLTRVTDAGLSHLKRLPHLRCVILRDTEVTDAAARDLQKALPSLRIVR